jgi:hypothetical protein
MAPKRWQDWVNGVLGLWMFASPSKDRGQSHAAAWFVPPGRVRRLRRIVGTRRWSARTPPLRSFKQTAECVLRA